ncbi:MAG: lytic transglycosylase domain-containing protein [Candidatus Cloacimonetes bacterium]|nr:lytic transglycosylase domain-containing protein [Candidatus Cloacimonadota bacterium]MDD4223515.1 lytic transglycosylase domain-containing protein [Candidatus Cloacimonadota bacterium]
MSTRKKNSRIRKLLYFPLVLLLVLLILVYNPVSVRLMTLSAAVVYGLDPGIFYRLVSTESRFRSFAVSPAKAIGLGQVRESTASYVHISHKRGMLYFPPYNLSISARYLNYLRGRFNDNWTLVLAAYNWGESNVERRMKGISIDPEADYRERFSDIRETYGYINKIMPPAKKA